MAENFKVVRKCRRLETNMNVPPVDNYLQIRILRNRNIPHDIRHRQIDSQTSKGQKPNILPRPNSLKTSSKVITSDISTQPHSNEDKTIGNTFGHEHLQIPIPSPRHEKYL